MFSNGISSFFMKEEKISFIRVLIALLSFHLIIFIIGGAIYLLTQMLASEIVSIMGFLYSNAFKNSIIMSVLFYIIISYCLVSGYNKSSIHYYGMTRISGAGVALFLFILYSIYMLFETGIFDVIKSSEEYIIHNHYYYYITYLLSIINISICLFIFRFIKLDISEKEVTKIKEGIFHAFILLFFLSISIFLDLIVFKYIINKIPETIHLLKVVTSVLFLLLNFIFISLFTGEMDRKILTSVRKMDSSYKNMVKESIRNIKLFEGVPLDQILITKISIYDYSLVNDSVRKHIKLKGDYEAIFRAKHKDTHNDIVYLAYFSKDGDLLHEEQKHEK